MDVPASRPRCLLILVDVRKWQRRSRQRKLPICPGKPACQGTAEAEKRWTKWKRRTSGGLLTDGEEMEVKTSGGLPSLACVSVGWWNSGGFLTDKEAERKLVVEDDALR